MLLGVHVSTEGGICQAVRRAHKLGCNTMQFFSRSPQRWRDKFIGQEEAEEFCKIKVKFKISPVFIHIPYLINLASPNPRLYKASVAAYIEDILEAHALEVDYIVTHMGSHKETTEKGGLKRLARALNKIIERTKDTQVGILLENTAGSGSWLGYKFIHMKKVLADIKDPGRIGLCLDTAHAYAAGYDIASAEGLERLVEAMETFGGTKLLKLVHFNDSLGELSSHHDRHAHIGEGRIGRQGMARVLNHPKLRNAAFILETPKDTPTADKKNLTLVRKLRKGTNGD